MFFKKLLVTLLVALALTASLVGVPQATMAASSASVATVTSAPEALVAVSAPTATVDSVQAQIPRKCLRYTKGATICAYKPRGQKIGKTFAMYNGKVVGWIVNYNIRSRSGDWIDGENHRTPSGTYPIYYFVRDAFSTKYHVPMPYYIKFRSDGIGIHYSYDFDVLGRTTSHGCIGLKSKAYAKRLFYWAKNQQRWPRVVTVINY